MGAIATTDELRAVVSKLRYRDWSFDVDDAGGIWIRRVEDDTTAPDRRVNLTNYVRIPRGADEWAMATAVLHEIAQAEAHERLERFRCVCGRTVFLAHDPDPSTQPPTGLALRSPQHEINHLCGVLG